VAQVRRVAAVGATEAKPLEIKFKSIFERITSMRITNAYAVAAVLVGAAFGTTLPVPAGTMSFKTPHQLKDTCAAAGGSFSAPGAAGVYACHLKGGAMIACGGNGSFARTCETVAARTILNPVLVRGNAQAAAQGASPRIEPAIY
jgi:hypothetical protein